MLTTYPCLINCKYYTLFSGTFLPEKSAALRTSCSVPQGTCLNCTHRKKPCEESWSLCAYPHTKCSHTFPKTDSHPPRKRLLFLSQIVQMPSAIQHCVFQMVVPYIRLRKRCINQIIRGLIHTLQHYTVFFPFSFSPFPDFVLMYLPLLILASFGFSALIGMTH